jgi:hypothetical protein
MATKARPRRYNTEKFALEEIWEGKQHRERQRLHFELSHKKARFKDRCSKVCSPRGFMALSHETNRCNVLCNLDAVQDHATLTKISDSHRIIRITPRHTTLNRTSAVQLRDFYHDIHNWIVPRA